MGPVPSADHPHQLNRTYFRARLNQTGPKYRYDLVEALGEPPDRLTVLGLPSRGPDTPRGPRLPSGLVTPWAEGDRSGGTMAIWRYEPVFGGRPGQ